MIDHVPPNIEVEKPWGKFEQYTHNALSTVKIITVQPGGALSLQYHHRRDELWVVLDAGAQIQLKRFAKGSILLQSAHFSTLRPTASASQHVAGFAGQLVS